MPKKLVSTIKKVVAKKVAKKVTSSAKKASPKKTLVLANNKNSFWVNNGQILDSLVALQKAFDEMEKAVFAHHVSPEKNDFANWVETILCDDVCANDLRKAKTLTSARSTIKKHLESYSI